VVRTRTKVREVISKSTIGRVHFSVEQKIGEEIRYICFEHRARHKVSFERVVGARGKHKEHIVSLIDKIHN